MMINSEQIRPTAKIDAIFSPIHRKEVGSYRYTDVFAGCYMTSLLPFRPIPSSHLGKVAIAVSGSHVRAIAAISKRIVCIEGEHRAYILSL
jgi:hypothetical protein